MQYKPWPTKARTRTILLVSLAETPFLLGGALLLASGDEALFPVGLGLVLVTAIAGSFFILRSTRIGKCPECERPLEMTLEGPYCIGCDVCYTNDPAKLGKSR